MAPRVILLPGDGIGPEIIAPAVEVLRAVGAEFDYEEHVFGGASIDAHGTALTDKTLAACAGADAVLLAAVGGPKWDTTDPAKPRPEQGLLGLRSGLGLFANLRPVRAIEALYGASPLREERIAGTDSRRADFDQSKLVEEYNATYKAESKLGQFDVWELELKVKPDTDVAFPVMKLWVDQASGNVLKRQEFALSGRLMRTLYYPRWQKLYSESKKAEVWYPGEIRIYDEVEKENSTIVVLKSVDLRPLEANIFTKAWLEAKSR